MSASGVRMTTRQICCSGAAPGGTAGEPAGPQRSGLATEVLLRRGPSCRAAAAMAILLMLAGLRLAQTDSETMDREGDGMVSWG